MSELVVTQHITRDDGRTFCGRPTDRYQSTSFEHWLWERDGRTCGMCVRAIHKAHRLAPAQPVTPAEPDFLTFLAFPAPLAEPDGRYEHEGATGEHDQPERHHERDRTAES